MEERSFHFLNRRTLTDERGRHAWSFGLRLGYWPCHRGPFMCVEFATHRIDMWWGTPSFEVPGK